MKISIDVEECSRDSPKFRADLEHAEQSISNLESKLEKVIKQCTVMIDAGKAYGSANSTFVSGIQELTAYFQGDKILEGTLKRYGELLGEIQSFHSVLMDLSSQSIPKDLQVIIRSELKQVKDAQLRFRKASDDYDSALTKHTSAPKTKPTECEEASNQLLVAKSKFLASSMEYTDILNLFGEKQRHDTLHTVFSYLKAQNTYFHQGYELFEDYGPFMKDVATKLVQLSDLTLAANRVTREHKQANYPSQSSVVNSSQTSNSQQENRQQDSDEPVRMEGYLFRRTSKGFKSWVKRWFIIENNQLKYTKRLSEGWTVMEEDLRLCSIKHYNDGERRFCLEIQSPSRSHVLQAIDEKECEQWVTALQAAVAAAYRDRSRTLTHQSSYPSLQNEQKVRKTESYPLLDKDKKHTSRSVLLYSIPGNGRCADCESDDPKWASVRLGITLCIKCCGVHRNLGVHVSKVRSIFLDDWEPEVLKVMVELGNDAVNSIYDYNLSSQDKIKKPTQSSSDSERIEYIKAKYVNKLFVKPLVPKDKSQPIKRWAVACRPRKTVIKDEKIENASCEGTPATDLSVDDDVVVFGSAVNHTLTNVPDESDLLSLEDEFSSSSSSEDSKSHTSLEGVDCLDANLLLYKAADARNIAVMLEALANNAEIDWRNPSDNNKTALIKAVESGSLAACEFLLLNSAQVDIVDNDTRPALHHATVKGHTAQVCQLIKRGANFKHKDSSGRDALSLAVEAEQADIVTLIRVASLRLEMNESDPGTLTDELFNEVFRDFSQLASNDPEKLKRSHTPKDQ